MIYKVTIYENINNTYEVKFFSNKKHAIQFGKNYEKQSYACDMGYSVEYSYKLDTFNTPKTKKDFLSFLNVYGSSF
jgi:hypothetical protein